MLIKSYLPNRNSQVRFGSSFSNFATIRAGVPQGEILSPILYNIYVVDKPTSPNTSVAEFADHEAIFTMHKDPIFASLNLKEHLDIMPDWYEKWRFKVNQSKSSHITFILRLPLCLKVFIDNMSIPINHLAKYLGLTFDRRLMWVHHIKTKRLALNARFRVLKTLFSNKHTNLNTKLLIYKSLIKPNVELWHPTVG